VSTDHEEIRTLLSEDEYHQWQRLGERILGDPAGAQSLDPPSAFYTAFCQAGPAILKEGSYQHLRNWAELGLEIAARSLPTATGFFRSTPSFLQSESVFHLRSWASGIMQILATGENGESAAAAFFASSAELLQFMTLRELREWTRIGLALGRTSTDLAAEYFSLVPDQLGQLYSTEWLRICQIGARLAKSRPEGVLALFRGAPPLLLQMSPAVRNTVLDAVRRCAAVDPSAANEMLAEMAAALRGLLYPIQEVVLKNQIRIEEISIPAARHYMKNVNRVLEDMHDSVLPLWIDRGIEILAADREEGIRYFSLQSAASLRELTRWGNAVVLDDRLQQLSLFTHAIAGKRLAVRATDELESEDTSARRRYPAGDGEGIYLPPVIADDLSHGGNLSLYKTAAAHQAGYVAFGTFEDGLADIIAHLGSLPSGQMALDIFLILEDGRIDRLLGGEYAGLKRDMAVVLDKAMASRPQPSTLPLPEALVEILLRRTTGYPVENDIPDDWRQHVRAIDEILSPEEGMVSYEAASSVWDTYTIARRAFEYVRRLLDGKPYTPMVPIAYRGKLDPELLPGPVSQRPIPGEIVGAGAGKGIYPIPTEELKAVIETMGIPENIELLEREGMDTGGLYISDLRGLHARGRGQKAERYDGNEERVPTIGVAARDTKAEGPFYYDEWDYLARGYRRKWCRLSELPLEPVESERVDGISDAYRDLILRVRKQFQRIRPDMLEIVRRVEWGDDIDLPAMVQAMVDQRTGAAPSDKIFSRREKKARRVATLFLLDMSASTSENVPVAGENTCEEKRIIDIEIEGLVVLMEALQALSHQYGIFGFSGYGREQVDFYRIKDFSDVYSEELKQRICGIEPKQGTRMGPVIRHAAGKLKAVETDQRILLLLSDGYPQDHDYGEDRRSNEYGLHDTMMALLEARKEGINPFCITVDQSGNDYLRKMCDPSSYLVLRDIHTLPEMLPRVVESLMA